jgi:hypothetical protein
MPVVEYMMHRDGPRRQVPEFIGDRGYWFNSADNTFIGWVDENPDYYVPSSVNTLTKEQLVTRLLTMHAATPFKNEGENPEEEATDMTDAEVTTMVETWYDNFVEQNS